MFDFSLIVENRLRWSMPIQTRLFWSIVDVILNFPLRHWENYTFEEVKHHQRVADSLCGPYTVDWRHQPILVNSTYGFFTKSFWALERTWILLERFTLSTFDGLLFCFSIVHSNVSTMKRRALWKVQTMGVKLSISFVLVGVDRFEFDNK